MVAMQPFLNTIFALEGFEWVAFWIALFVGYLLSGFFVDYLMHNMAFGPYVNGLIVIGGLFGGICLRYNYFLHDPYFRYEPITTMALCFGTVTVIFGFIGILKARGVF